mgnify:CR=1 FL=1
MNAPADYIRAYMTERPIDLSRAALVMIDMQPLFLLPSLAWLLRMALNQFMLPL